MYTRSHSELGRENFQRQWYCVSRHGRVGRCQVFQARRDLFGYDDQQDTHGFDAGWSSPVARQAHNLKVVGSNPAPATNSKKAALERERLFCCPNLEAIADSAVFFRVSSERRRGVRAIAIVLHRAALACVLQFLAVEAFAHVGDADHSPVVPGIAAPGIAVPGIESGKQGPDKILRLEHIGASMQGFAKPTYACGLPPVENRLFAGFTLAGNLPGAAPVPLSLSEVRLDSVRASGAVYREVLSLFDGLDVTSDIVQVAEGVTREGASCPLYVSVGSGDSRQTFWRFTPDDEPESWFDDGGRRLGAAFAPPKPGARLSSPFGPRRYYGRASGGGFHDGIDYESKVGEPIFAAADGVIELQGGHFEYGLTVKIRHAPQQVTLYAHMSRFVSGMAVGSKVRKGEVIGYVGMTGRSTGAHLHFSTIVHGKFVDPAPYLSNNGNRHLSAPSLATFRKWQQEIRAVVKGAPDQQRRPHIDELDWTKRI